MPRMNPRPTDDEVLELRAKLVSQIVDEFEASGISYTCNAVVMDFATKRIIPLTEHWSADIKVHRYVTFGRIKRQASIEMHKRFHKRIAPLPKEGK